MSTIDTEYGGEYYLAEYEVDDGVLTVYTEGGSKATQVGGMKEKPLAKMLLLNLICEGKAMPAEKEI